MRRTLPSGRRAVEHDGRAPATLFVDSSAWLALLSRRDQHHADAERRFREAVRRQSRLITTNLVIAEVHRLTLFRSGMRLAWLALDRMEAIERLAIHFATADDHTVARRWLERLAPRPVTYADAVSFAVIEATGCSQVLGFDDDFGVAGFTFWRDGR